MEEVADKIASIHLTSDKEEENDGTSSEDDAVVIETNEELEELLKKFAQAQTVASRVKEYNESLPIRALLNLTGNKIQIVPESMYDASPDTADKRKESLVFEPCLCPLSVVEREQSRLQTATCGLNVLDGRISIMSPVTYIVVRHDDLIIDWKTVRGILVTRIVAETLISMSGDELDVVFPERQRKIRVYCVDKHEESLVRKDGQICAVCRLCLYPVLL